LSGDQQVSERRCAPWVASVAATLAEGRRAVLAFARSAPAEFWARPSTLAGWTNHDVLAHLAGGNDQLLQRLLRDAAGTVPLGPAFLHPDTDDENARGVATRRGWPIARLLAELEQDGEEVQELLAHLTEEDENRRWRGFPLTLGAFLHIVEEERHDLLHLDELRAGLLPSSG
jgi:uncharacterized protein (TIGR03083 family)